MFFAAGFVQGVRAERERLQVRSDQSVLQAWQGEAFRLLTLLKRLPFPNVELRFIWAEEVKV